MLGAHQLVRLAAALAIGIGIVLSLGGAAGAAEGAILGPRPFQIALPDSALRAPIHSVAVFKRQKGPMVATLRIADTRAGATLALTTAGLFDFGNKSLQDKPNGLLGFSDGGALAHAFADIPSAPKLLLSFGQSDLVQFEVAQLPIPGTVWLFLAALALLFGISRRQVTASR